MEVETTKKFSKELRKTIAASNMSRQEMKMIVDIFYDVQDTRIETGNKISAIERGKDIGSTEVLKWRKENLEQEENEIKKILDKVTDNNTVGVWLKSITGIGPTLAAGIIAYFDISRANYASNFISYAGLNDNNRPWLGKNAKTIVADTVVGSKVTSDDIINLSAKTGWKVDYLTEKCAEYDDDGNIKSYSKDKLTKAISMLPYNKELKKLMYKCATSFIKVCNNKKSLYGRLYKERKAIEIAKNDNFEFKAQADEIIASGRYSKNTEAYASYIQGKLPPAHINARAMRYVEKIFVSHIFDEMWWVANKTTPPRAYVFGQLGHNDYIAPEVPYDIPKD